MDSKKSCRRICSSHFILRGAIAATLLIGLAIISSALIPVAAAQTNISGDVVGTVTDPSGAAIPNATVTVANKATGASKTVVTGGRGDYRMPLLNPGDYEISVAAAGFEGAKTSVTVPAGASANGDIKLVVGKASTTVDVTTTQPLLHTEDAQISTSYTMEQVQALPNPGNDLTFVAQTSPGAVMNTEMGMGNFSVFGLPATSNSFTVNGGYENDPFLNVNNSGATNLLLGNNDIADVTVTSNAYDAAFGGLGGAQLSEISRSGGNSFHGNADYWWNGRILNASPYFNNQTPTLTPRPFDNVNQWAASVGGPIKKDKAFWFVDYEGLRVILPTTSTVYAPSQEYICQVLGTCALLPTTNSDGSVNPYALPCGNLVTGYIPTPGSTPTNPGPCPAGAYPTGSQSAQIPLYQSVFSVYQHPANYAHATTPTATCVTAGNCDPYAVSFPVQNSNFTHEWLITGRIDVNLGVNDKLYGHSNVDKGLQATYTDPFNALFNADSPQPQYQGQLSETHTFSPNLTNQALFSAIYYRAIFTNTNLAASSALIPFSADAAELFGGSKAFTGATDQFSPIGGENFLWPQGRNVTGYQFQDDLSWTRGNHTLRVGWTMRRDDITDYGPSVLTTPLVASDEGAGFATGNLDGYLQQFPARTTQPVALYTMGTYLQDTWKALPNLTVTYGMRFEHNSNPICITSCFNVLTNDFFGSTNSTMATPYNQLITAGQKQAFSHLQAVGYEPRFGFSWQPFGVGSHTVLRGGFGMFADAFPGQIADSLLNNAPGNVQEFVAGYTDPAVSGSAASIASSQAAGFVAGFANGTANANNVGQVGFSNATKNISYPTYEEYSLALEQQLNRNTSISVNYVGNHGYHEPVVNGAVNAYQQASSACTYCGNFPGLPATAPVASLSRPTEVYSGASSNYNGLITTVTHRERYLTLQFNYAYSHALDEISNGGFNSFGGDSLSGPEDPYNLAYNYGNADYDTRNYISGSYVVTLPYWGGPHVLTDSWQFAGTVFHNTGLPFTVVDGNVSGALGNYASNIYAARLNNTPVHCGENNVYNNATNSIASPCAITAASGNFAEATAFGQQARNQLRGPNFTDTDLDVTKGFKIPKWESAQLKLGAQFFNLFNHPNFAQPVADVSNQQQNGGIFGTVNPPTSILGSFLGGNASPRLIQAKMVFQF